MKAITSWWVLIFMRLMQVKNYLRTLLRQSGFWAALSGMGVAFAITRAFLKRGGAEEPAAVATPAALGDIPSFDLVAGALVWALVLWNLGRRTKHAPFAIKEPDAVLILTSPITSRAIFSFHLALSNLHVLWMAMWWLGVSTMVLGVEAVRDEAALSWAYVGFLVASLLGRSCGLAVWSWLQAMDGKAPERAERVRRGVRAGLTVVSLASLFWLTAPIISGLNPGADAALFTPSLIGRAVERLEAVTAIPPASWVRAVASGVPAGLAPALLLVVLAQAVAVRFATDYYEPLVRRAEEEGDLMRRTSRRDADAQAAVLQTLSSRTKGVVQLPPFGRGPGALVWSGLVRSVRITTAIATLSLVTNVVVGAGLGAAVRWWGLAPKWALLGPALLALLSGGAGNLINELNRPHIYLIPGAAWKKLLATGLVSVVDQAVHGTLVLITASLVAPLSIVDVIPAWVVHVAATALAQAAAGFGQVALPLWIRGGARSMLLLGLTLLLAAPGLVFCFAGGSPSVVSLALPVVVAFLIPAVVAFALSVALFGRAEMTA